MGPAVLATVYVEQPHDRYAFLERLHPSEQFNHRDLVMTFSAGGDLLYGVLKANGARDTVPYFGFYWDETEWGDEITLPDGKKGMLRSFWPQSRGCSLVVFGERPAWLASILDLFNPS